MLKGLKSYKPSKYKCSDFLSKTHDTFLLWLITFEPLKQKQSYIPLLKVLMCCMNAWGAQWQGGIFILQFTSLKMVLLLNPILHEGGHIVPTHLNYRSWIFSGCFKWADFSWLCLSPYLKGPYGASFWICFEKFWKIARKRFLGGSCPKPKI